MFQQLWLFDTVAGYDSNDRILLNDFFQVIFSDIRNAQKVRIQSSKSERGKSLYIFKMTSVTTAVLPLMLVVLQNVFPRGVFLIFYWQGQLRLKLKFKVSVVWYYSSSDTTGVRALADSSLLEGCYCVCPQILSRQASFHG